MRRRRLTTILVTSAFLSWALLVGACGDDDDSGTSQPVTPLPTLSSEEAPKPDPTKPLPTPCPPSPNGIPDGAVSRPIVDVDFDGQPDTGWLFIDDGDVALGITTASGGTFSTAVALTGPEQRVALVADVDGRGTIVALASDGRTANLYQVMSCGLVTVINQEGTPYQFDLGFRGNGTGVGCIDLTDDGITELVGLNAVPEGDQVKVTRTAVPLRGAEARNDISDEVTSGPDDPSALTALDITCGEVTMARDGIQVAG